ncbi:glycosyltransferase family 87 protein [Vibrio ziniensis]|uniref:DUF2029 domain-containing protein n=1 Tax=Vibrio ziniensis TaxID=2711221 RepID=A0A6G7CKZ6_9VIBR|nr:glycosyltransferase family 87 protein [Vibrio ziniensis]QIH42772.1 DUF2029 domain-containing protein [Vibrio ziniensis]
MFLQAKTSKFILIVGLFVGFLGSLKFLYIDNKDFLNGDLSRGQIVGRDFLHSWTAVKLASEGKYDDIYNPELLISHSPDDVKKTGVAFNFAYPPQTLALLLPLSNFNYITSLIIWGCFSILCYISSSIIFEKKVSNIALLLIAPTTFLNISMGQNGLFTAALLISGLILLESKPRLSGILFGILTIKPHLGILIPVALIAGGYKKSFLWAMISTICFFVISLIVFGSGVWEAWFNNAPWVYAKNFIENGTGFALFMQPSPFMTIRLLFNNTELAWLTQIISAILSSGCVIYTFKKSHSLELKASVLITATYLVSPYIHSYDMAALNFVMIWQARKGLENGFIYGEQTLLVVAWVMPLIMMSIGYLGFPIFPLITLLMLSVLVYKVNITKNDKL